MKTKPSLRRLALAALLLAAGNFPFSTAHAQSTAFGYQGRLNATNGPASRLTHAATAGIGRRDVGARHLAELTAGQPAAGRLPATDELKLAIGLPLRNQAGLTGLIHDLYDPASPMFRQYLSADQFAAQYGPSAEDYEAVIQFARTNHLVVEKTYGNRVLLDVRGNVADIERAFGVHLLTFHHPVEPRDFYAPDTEPTVDANLPILAVKGLDNYELPRPMHRRIPSGKSPTLGGAGPGGLYMGSDFRNAYVPGVTNTGSGQTVGLFQMDGYSTNDIIYYENANSMAHVTLTNVLLGGFNGNVANTNNAVEVSLDIEMAISMAPGLARVMVYEAPQTSVGAYDILTQMATDNLAKQISSSWVIERIVSTPVPDQMYQQFAAQGQSFFQAAGDDDSFGPGIYQIDDDPYVITVGGTTLTTTGAGGSYVSEKVWQYGYDSQAGFDVGTGGGISSTFTIPTYQLGLNMTTNQGSTTMRNVPDVALTADNVYVRANTNDNGEAGTSCAAPLWAGLMALVNQQAAAKTNPAVGFINPTIYALGQSTNYTKCFHDITSGNNTNASNTNLFYAVPGYDLCTGWGTPAGSNFINALVSPAVPPQFIFVTNHGDIIITRYGGAGGAVSIPATLGGLPVTSIGDFAFYEWTNLTSVIIPNSVTNIGVGAFADCPNLTSVIVSNGILTLTNYAFAGCSNLSRVYFAGNAPAANATVFANATNATVYYLPGTTGWASTFDGRPAVELIVSNVSDNSAGSLRQMLGVMPAGWTLTFATSLSGSTILLSSGELQVTNSLTIDASALTGGIRINGSAASRVMEVVSGNTVALKSLTITNGMDPSGYGGGIFNEGNLTLSQCLLTGNTTPNPDSVDGLGGAAIYNGGTLALNQCTVSSNSCPQYPSRGGGVFNGGVVTISQSTISGNSANFAGGGVVNEGSLVAVSDSTIANNTSTYGGGIDNFSGTLIINESTVSGNSASSDGGGIYNYISPAVAAITNSIVGGNTGPGADIFNANTIAFGGANLVQTLANSGGSTTGPAPLSANPLLGPLANYGGLTQTMSPQLGSPAIDAGSSAAVGGLTVDQIGNPRISGPSVDLGSVELLPGSIVLDNADSAYGSLGYVALYGNGPVITFVPGLSGQSILLTNGTITLSRNVTIDASALTNGIIINGGHTNRIFQIAGGATNVLIALTLTNGYPGAGNSGGAIVNNGTLSLINCTLAGNSTDSSATGGAIWSDGPLNLYGCTLSGNVAGFAGAIDNYGSICTAQNCTFAGNSAVAGNGGAIDSDFSATLSVYHCTFTGNSASGVGGGIDNYLSQLNVTNTILAANTDYDIYNWSGGTNTAGGSNIVQVLGNAGTLIGASTILAVGPQLAPLGSYGGPTQTCPPMAGSPAIDAAPFTTLATDQRGFPRVVGPAPDIGAVEFQDASPVVTAVADSGVGSLRYASTYTTNGDYITFSNNLSGATILLAGPVTLNKNLTIDASTLANGIHIDGNQAGSVFYVTGGNVVLTALTITNGNGLNGIGGGGIYNTANLTVNQCTLAGNSTPYYGGGIENNGGTLVVNQCTLTGNSCTNSGGAAIDINLGSVTVNQSTLTLNNAPNSGGSGGIGNYGGSATIFNSIVAGNTSPSNPNTYGTITQTGVNLTSGDPLLASLGNYGGPTPTMPPLPGSPAIDTGAATSFATDQRGLPRVVGPAPDIGAVEFQDASPIVITAADSGIGSLRFASTYTTNGDYITFSNNLSGATILLTSGELVLNKSLTIDASALTNGITINGNQADRVFYVAGGSTVALTALTMSNGLLNGVSPGLYGGGIENEGNLTVYRCTLVANSAGNSPLYGFGGAIENDGNLVVNESTLTGNTAHGGAGIASAGPLTVNQCTVVGNTGTGGGANSDGGIFPLTATAIYNSIVASNAPYNFDGVSFTGSDDLTNGNPLLASLGNYGGPTPTMPPLPGSPAVDAGGASSFTTDQRGFPRVLGLAPDIGAVEGIYNAAGPGELTGATRLGNGSFTFGFTNYTDTSYTVLASTNVASPLNSWSILGAAVESPVGSGLFSFTDPDATNYPNRFYRTRSP